MHYTLLVRHSGQAPRPCAMFPAATPHEADTTSKKLRSSGLLAFVPDGGSYSLRPSSRREIGLMQRFYAACNGMQVETLTDLELDSLVARRRDLEMTFFVGIYTSETKLRDWVDGKTDNPSPGATNPVPDGSGGVAAEAEPVNDAEDVQQETEPSGAVEEEKSHDGEEAVPDTQAEGSDDLSILQQLASTTDVKDEPVDLGDDELF